MADSITRITHQSYGSRIGNSCKAMIFGPILMIAGIWLLVWNEGNSVMQHKALTEALNIVIEVDPTTIDTMNEGSLVHFIGMAEADDTLSDSLFGVSTEALKLKRKVEMYQWVEQKHTETKKNTGGSTDTITTYTYTKEWREELISSNYFEDPTSHTNPSSMAYSTTVMNADPIHVGGYTIPAAIKSRMTWFQDLQNTISLENIPDETTRNEAQMYGNGFYLGESPTNPDIGDMKVTFQEVPDQDISVVAQQIGSTLSSYTAKSGGTVLLVEPGPHDVAEMFLHANQALNMQTWLIRLGGFVLLFLAIKIVMEPLSVLADVIPFIGNIIEAGNSCIAFLLAGIIAITTIAISWLAYRPLLSIGLFALVGGLIYAIRRQRQMKDGNEVLPMAEAYELPSMGEQYKDEPV